MAESQKFAILKRARRIWAVGAIHGEAARLRALHDRLAERFQAPGDRIVYLGNYLGRGPDVGGTVDELLEFRRRVISIPGVFASDVVFLRGGQEEMWQKLLQLQFAVNPREVLDWMLGQGLGSTLAAYGCDLRRGLSAARDGALSLSRWTSTVRAALSARPGHRDFLSALRRAAYDENARLLFVHAGVDPSRPLASQGDTLWWGTPGFGQWDQPFGEFDRVVRGYDAARGGFVEMPFALTVDSGCGFGGKLTAICLSAQGEIEDRLDL
jgi:serine/threonine protein phosphatase 1